MLGNRPAELARVLTGVVVGRRMGLGGRVRGAGEAAVEGESSIATRCLIKRFTPFTTFSCDYWPSSNKDSYMSMEDL